MITLVLGGARSGKSLVAERLLDSHDAVTYIATIVTTSADTNLEDRVAAHRSRRPASWSTIEPPYDLAEVLRSEPNAVLLDSVGPWLALQADMSPDATMLIDALESRTSRTVIVSEEVGMGVHPDSELGLRFRDELGRLNQAIAAVADECLLVVAGRILRLDAT